MTPTITIQMISAAVYKIGQHNKEIYSMSTKAGTGSSAKGIWMMCTIGSLRVSRKSKIYNDN